MGLGKPFIAVITQETRLESIKSRFGTTKAWAFRMKQAAFHEQERLVRSRKSQFQDNEDMALNLAEELVDAANIESEDEVYHKRLNRLLHEIDVGHPVRTIKRSFLPNFEFFNCLCVVVFGQDGLVANSAKYVGNLPIIGVNPDPKRYDGILLPFVVENAGTAVQRTVQENANLSKVTLAEVTMNDGQTMLAFNDFFVGCRSHKSARYTIEKSLKTETQLSSGIIISTGVGSTGWMSSVFNMVNAVSAFCGSKGIQTPAMTRSERRLFWSVREPFQAVQSGIQNSIGFVQENEELVIGSEMANDGVIFSDGVESDFIEFNSGAVASFGVADQQATLVD